MLSSTAVSKATIRLFLSRTTRSSGSISRGRRSMATHLLGSSSSSNGIGNDHHRVFALHDKNNLLCHQQVRSIFIQQLETPNPESIKFIPDGKPVLESEDNTGYFVTKNGPQEDILRSPLAKEIFKIEGVKAVYLGYNFVTITKYAECKWMLLRPQILDSLMTFFDTGKPALVDQPEITDTTIFDDDDEVVAMIKELIEDRIRPAVQEDGGDIRYVGFDFETGIVTVQLAGSCVGCPSSSVTLKQGVENMLMHYIPEVKLVEALEEEAEEDGTGEGKEGGEETKKQKSYEERLASAGIPFSD